MNTALPHNTPVHTERGYTLLFSVLTATLVLGVAVFILSVSKKQYGMAVVARESMYAIYAADGAIECMALSFTSTTSPVTCNGTPIPFDAGDYVTNVPVAGFQGFPYSLSAGKVFPLSSVSNGPCAVVNVVSGLDAEPPNESKTVIEARGYNQCDSTGPLPSSRTVERALRLTKR